jgi:hypothetical protein
MALKRMCIYILFQSAITNDSDLKSVRRWMESYSNNENEQSEQEESFIKNKRTTGRWGAKAQALASTKTHLLNGMIILALFERAYEFGQQITHLSHAPRLQRWGNQLSILVASLTIFVPLIECTLDE